MHIRDVCAVLSGTLFVRCSHYEMCVRSMFALLASTLCVCYNCYGMYIRDVCAVLAGTLCVRCSHYEMYIRYMCAMLASTLYVLQATLFLCMFSSLCVKSCERMVCILKSNL